MDENKTFVELALEELQKNDLEEYGQEIILEEYLARELDIDLDTVTEKEKNVLTKNFVHLMCTVIDDLRSIDKRLSEYRERYEFLKNDRSNAAEFKRRKIQYFCDINKNARSEILDFVTNGIKQYLLDNPFDAQNPDNKVILFIDEIHMLAEGNQTYDKIAQLMKPALARGNMKVIGATTLQESQCLFNDPAFNRRFTRLIVDELSKEQIVEILIHMADEMVRHYNHIIDLDAQVLREVVNVADHYKTIGSHRPDNAIALLDRTMADAVLQEMLSSNKGKSKKKHTPKLLTEEQIKKTAMKLMTGNNEKVETDMALLKKNLEVIKGQDEILEYLIDVFERDNLNLFPRKVPLSILFAGNSGVGKTEIAKIISRTLTGMEPIILNMTEFSNSSALNRIIGAPSGFVGSESKAELPFDILESNPYQVILLDEFEKADIAVERKVEIKVSITDGALVIDYRDSGPGISQSLLESGVIFEPEFTTKIGGTGLGLAIAGEAANRNDLSLKAVQSENGAHFILRKKDVRDKNHHAHYPRYRRHYQILHSGQPTHHLRHPTRLRRFCRRLGISRW